MENLKEYIKKIKTENGLSKVDQFLFSYMDTEIKEIQRAYDN